jgi:hypothetical protein
MIDLFTWLWGFFCGLPGWLWAHPFWLIIAGGLGICGIYLLVFSIGMKAQDVGDIKRRNPDRRG